MPPRFTICPQNSSRMAFGMHQLSLELMLLIGWVSSSSPLFVETSCSMDKDCPWYQVCRDRLPPSRRVCVRCSDIHSTSRILPFRCLLFMEAERIPSRPISARIGDREEGDFYGKVCESSKDCYHFLLTCSPRGEEDVPEYEVDLKVNKTGGESWKCRCLPPLFWNGTNCLFDGMFNRLFPNKWNSFSSGMGREVYRPHNRRPTYKGASGDDERHFIRKIFTTPLGLLFICHLLVLLGYFFYNLRRNRLGGAAGVPPPPWEPRGSGAGLDDAGRTAAPPPSYDTTVHLPDLEEPPTYEDAVKNLPSTDCAVTVCPARPSRSCSPSCDTAPLRGEGRREGVS